MKKKLKVTFAGEPGLDMGGLTKEWFLLLIRRIFRPEYGKIQKNVGSFFASPIGFPFYLCFPILIILRGKTSFRVLALSHCQTWSLDLYMYVCMYKEEEVKFASVTLCLILHALLLPFEVCSHTNIGIISYDINLF